MGRVDYLSGLTVFTKDSFIDDRGELFTIWKDTHTPFMNFNHDKAAFSDKNVLRGFPPINF